MQQRVVNAMALVGEPDLVIADEPTSGLDAELVDTTAAQLLEISERGSALLVITHDLRLAERLGGRLALLYASRIVELGATARSSPARRTHTGASCCGRCPSARAGRSPALSPELTALPAGCAFADRCEDALRPLHHVPARPLPRARRRARPVLSPCSALKLVDSFRTGACSRCHAVSLGLQPGARLGLVGPSGAGKSTLARDPGAAARGARQRDGDRRRRRASARGACAPRASCAIASSSSSSPRGSRSTRACASARRSSSRCASR